MTPILLSLLLVCVCLCMRACESWFVHYTDSGCPGILWDNYNGFVFLFVFKDEGPDVKPLEQGNEEHAQGDPEGNIFSLYA